MYETENARPLLRLAWNMLDQNYIATFGLDSTFVTLLDIRAPSTPVAKLWGHSAAINSLAWSPHMSTLICSGGEFSLRILSNRFGKHDSHSTSSFVPCASGDDGALYVWDITQAPGDHAFKHCREFEGAEEINHVAWSLDHAKGISALDRTGVSLHMV